MKYRHKFVRTAARAVIIHDERILLAKMHDHRGDYFILPGGGQLNGETLHQTVVRECAEEVGAVVSPTKLLYIREYIGRNHGFAPRHKDFHQLEHVFACTIHNPNDLHPSTELDKFQVGFTWLPLADLPNVRFYPEALKPFFNSNPIQFPALYFGDCN